MQQRIDNLFTDGITRQGQFLPNKYCSSPVFLCADSRGDSGRLLCVKDISVYFGKGGSNV